MSRRIDLSKPLSEVDIKYLKSRNRHGDILNNQKKFGDAKTTKPKQDAEAAKEAEPSKTEGGQKLSLDSDIFEKVKAMNADELKVELAKAGLKAGATERENRIALAQHLQSGRDNR